MAETISKPIENKSKHDKTKNGKAATFATRGPLSLRSVMARETPAMRRWKVILWYRISGSLHDALTATVTWILARVVGWSPSHVAKM